MSQQPWQVGVMDLGLGQGSEESCPGLPGLSGRLTNDYPRREEWQANTYEGPRRLCEDMQISSFLM